jgi:cell division protein FtsA
MKRTKIGAIDIGTTKICSVLADNYDGDIRILGMGVAPSQGLQKGMVVNINEARDSIRRSIRAAEQTAGYRMESACIGVTGRSVSSMNNRGVVAITRGDQVVRRDDLRRVLDVARTVKIPSDSRLLHIIPRGYTIDGQEGIKNPVGMHGFRLDVETHIITAAATSVQNLTRCIDSLGIEINGLVLESLASAEVCLAPEEKDSGVILADIGGGTTDVAIFKANSICHTSVIPVAGYQITRDISIGLNLYFEIAEELKKRYGSVVAPNYKEEADRVLTHGGYKVSQRHLCEIIRIRVEELLRLIMLELPSTEGVNFAPSGIVLTGGSANLPGITELATQVTKLPARIGAPHHLYSVSDSLCGPAYATSVGLLLWKLRNQSSTSLPELAGLRGFVNRMSRILPVAKH